MPPEMQFPDYAQLWTPTAWIDAERAVRGDHNYLAIGRLKPGIDVTRAQAEITTISRRLEQDYPVDDKGWGALIVPLRDDLVSDVRPALLVLLGAVAFVLLIACANVANLLLAKTLARKKEIAIRTALGAGRGRVLAQILSETTLLALAGGALGLVLAHLGVQLIVAVLADKLPRSTEVGLDLGALGFTLVISVATGILSGLLPALRLMQTDVNESLKQGLGRTGSDSGGNRTRSMLVISEVALSVMLLVGAGLMVRSLWLLRGVNPGFGPDHVLTMSVSIPSSKFSGPAQQISFFDRVLERVRAIPGVKSAATIDALPLSGNGSHQPVAIEGRPVVPMAEQPEVDVRVIAPGYLSSMHVPVLCGRNFNDADVAGRPNVALISDSMAKRLWPNEDPIGRHLTLTFFPNVSREVVGIVGDVKLDALNETRSTATLYYPLDQLAWPTGTWRSFGLSLVVRTSSNPTNAVSAVGQAVHEIDCEVPLLDIKTMDDMVAGSVSPQRFNMVLLTAFAVLAMVLAAVGIYSVLSYNVRRRVREIGVRMALGAQIRDVLRLIVMEGMKPTLLGLGIGLAGSLALERVLANLIYGVRVADPATFLAVSCLLASVGLVASIIPAYRATRVDPMRTLREE